MKRLCLVLSCGLSTALLVMGCSPLVGRSPDAAASSASPSASLPASPSLSPASPAPSALPVATCHDPLPEALQSVVTGDRLATAADFVPAIQTFESNRQDFTCSIYSADFNQDGNLDYALLLINEQTANFRTQLALGQPDGSFQTLVLKEYQPVTDPAEGVVYTSMQFKPAGELGPAARDYSPLEPAQRDAFVATPALEIWQAIELDDQGRPSRVDEISSLAYCSDVYYVTAGQLMSFTVCD